MHFIKQLNQNILHCYRIRFGATCSERSNRTFYADRVSNEMRKGTETARSR